MGSGDDTNVGPAAICDEFGADNVFPESRTFTVVITVILDCDHHVLPPHVEEIAGTTKIVDDGYLRSGP
jgi:hypothetical protein